jgi:hypothetical protein
MRTLRLLGMLALLTLIWAVDYNANKQIAKAAASQAVTMTGQCCPTPPPPWPR